LGEEGKGYEQQQSIIKAIFSSSEQFFLLDERGDEKVIRTDRHAFASGFARGAVYDLGAGGVWSGRFEWRYVGLGLHG
jgi:hypothetical protein